MEYIIHLTEKCNLNCTYCYEKKKNKIISFEDIKNLIDYQIKQKHNYTIIFFYGGEPLLQKKIIRDTIDYRNSKKYDTKIPLIDEKIRTYIKDGYNCNEECNLGMRAINVGTDGNFYPCMQFVNNEKFIIGNCKDGIDVNARINLIKNSKKENETCKECAIRKRCKHTCACKNYMITNDINELSPIICETERIIIEVADKMAKKLYKENSKIFYTKILQ